MICVLLNILALCFLSAEKHLVMSALYFSESFCRKKSKKIYDHNRHTWLTLKRHTRPILESDTLLIMIRFGIRFKLGPRVASRISSNLIHASL